MADNKRKRILSGVQPSGKLHLGNYFGAIKQHIALQEEGECFYFIADYHALTTLGDAVRVEVEAAKDQKRKPRTGAEILRENVRDVALDYLALGLDPAKVAFYRQSDVPEVTELAWIFSTVTGMGLLERAHSYKDKLAQGIAPSVGLFTYPILMAADILIVRSDIVPVGQDQVQHLEMTRDMAGYFNQAFAVDIFPLPRERLDVGAKVPGTDGKKMAKSAKPPNSIDIFAEGKPLKKSVMSIVTDSTPPEAPKDPETRTPYQLYKLVASAEEAEELAQRYRAGGMGDGTAKQMLLDKIEAYFGPFREKRKMLAADKGYVEDVLREGAKRARAEAEKTMELVRSARQYKVLMLRFDPTELRKYAGLTLIARQIVEGFLTGVHRSPYKGFSVEFAEHRQYTPGDEIRHIDWRAVGKTDRYYVKEYEEETNLKAYLVVDGSGSMGFRGSKKSLSKFEYAQHVAASLAYLMLHQMDGVGLITLDTKIRSLIPPKASPKHLLQVLTTLEKTEPGGETAMSPLLHELAGHHMKRRGMVIILSDFFDQVDSLVKALQHLRHRNHEVVLLHMLAPEEMDFPYKRLTQFRNLELRENKLLVDARRLRDDYLHNFEQFRTELKQRAGKLHIDYHLLRTDDPVDRALGIYLSRRQHSK